jgi:hypothetical protein
MQTDILELISHNTRIGQAWSLDEWKQFILETIEPVYHKKDYHPAVIDQIICQAVPRLNKGRFIFHSSLERDRRQLNKLKQLPKSKAQNSFEWHLFRHDHINASEAQGVFLNNNKGLLSRKVNPFVHRLTNGVASELGHRYEPLSVQITQLKTGKQIFTFESIEHPVHTFLAASPDGIDEDGVMKEIKNPSTREIIGVPKTEYWVQTQLQLECCDLNALDFIESKFKEYACPEYYDEDTTRPEYKGLILELWNNDKVKRFYSEFNRPSLEYMEWKQTILNDTELINQETHINEVYWKLEQYSSFRVYRDRQWFQQALPKMEQFWNDVKLFRNIGLPENLVSMKKKKEDKIKELKEQSSVCLLDDDDYENY